jgi:hypothetical protein
MSLKLRKQLKSRRKNVQKKLTIICGIALLLGITGAVIYGNYWRNKYVSINRTIEAARGAELEQQLRDVTAELERTKSALVESQQSVGGLEEIDRQRNAGIERIERSLDATGTAIRNAQSGNARAEAAFGGISELSYILEAEFGRSPNKR